MSAPVLAMERVGARFGEFALHDIDLALERGEYGVLLGPSGGGKSVLLQLAAGFFLPESGRVLLDGQDVLRVPPERRGIGFVQQRPALFPHHDVRGNIAYGLRARGVPAPERQARVAELLERLHLREVVDRPVATLSGGEAQRVAIARALAPRPRLLLLDEPLSLLDHNTRLELQEELARLHAELDVTVLHVTHNRDEARALGRRCAVMRAGTIEQCGPIDEVWSQPASAFVATFLGLPPASAAVPKRTGADPAG